jgi:2-oxoglutarate ferredoxin oxidoreductase subunit gamma
MSSEASSTAKQRTEILISGFGGQGVVRMGQIIGLCAIYQGQKVTMLKSHGTETRGGYVRTQIVISPDYVDSPVVEKADVFVAFSEPAYKKFYDLAAGAILYDPELVENLRDDSPERHMAVPATKISNERFDNAIFANMIMLGVLTRVSGMVMDSMRKAMLEVIPRFHDDNLEALGLGYDLDVAVNAVQGAVGADAYEQVKGN